MKLSDNNITLVTSDCGIDITAWCRNQPHSSTRELSLSPGEAQTLRTMLNMAYDSGLIGYRLGEIELPRHTLD